MRLWKQREDPAILLFHQLNRAHHNATLAQMARHNVQDVGNPMLLFILAQCAEQPEGTVPSQKKLAELLHVSPATVANSLKSLERGGYVRKEPDPSDARCNRVYITDKGLQAVQTCVTVFDTVDQQVLRGFSPAELELLKYTPSSALGSWSCCATSTSACWTICVRSAATATPARPGVRHLHLFHCLTAVHFPTERNERTHYDQTTAPLPQGI